MKKHLLPFVYLVLILLGFSACEEFKDETLQETEYDYFLSKTEGKSFDIPAIKLYIQLAAAASPELSSYFNTLIDELDSKVQIYKIKYRTTFNGEEVMASGLIAVPTAEGTYPMMSFQNGTNTVKANAPSQDKQNLLFDMLTMMSSTGFVIALPDYLGFGDSDLDFHPYLHKESTVQSVLDMLRAVREMMSEDSSINVNNELYLTGYSQGGWATMHLQKAIEMNYSDEFDLKASACGAGPYSIETVTEYVNAQESYPQPYFLAYLYNSYEHLELTTPIDSIFKEPYAGKIPGLFNGQKDGAAINAELTTSVADLFQPGFLSGWKTSETFAHLHEMLEENSVSGYNTKIPTRLYHGTADTYVPFVTSEKIYLEFQAAGADELVVPVPLDGMDHTSAIMPAELSSILWFIELKNGQ